MTVLLLQNKIFCSQPFGIQLLHKFTRDVKNFSFETKNNRLKIGATSLLLYLLEHQGENLTEELSVNTFLFFCGFDRMFSGTLT